MYSSVQNPRLVGSPSKAILPLRSWETLSQYRKLTADLLDYNRYLAFNRIGIENGKSLFSARAVIQNGVHCGRVSIDMRGESLNAKGIKDSNIDDKTMS